MQEYERITNCHQIGPWSELVADDATYWFTTGSYSGKDAVVAAVARSFDVIRDEDYRISGVEWVAVPLSASSVRCGTAYPPSRTRRATGKS